MQFCNIKLLAIYRVISRLFKEDSFSWTTKGKNERNRQRRQNLYLPNFSAHNFISELPIWKYISEKNDDETYFSLSFLFPLFTIVVFLYYYMCINISRTVIMLLLYMCQKWISEMVALAFCCCYLICLTGSPMPISC